MSCCNFGVQRTYYPLTFPSSIIYLMQNYSDRDYLSLLYYAVEAEISLSQRYLCSSNTSALFSGACVGNNAVCLTSMNAVASSFCSGTNVSLIARNTIQSQSNLLTQISNLLNTLSLTLNTMVKNYVMSDCTLIKAFRSEEICTRNYLIMLVSIQEIGIALSVYAGQTSTNTNVQSFSSTVVTSLSTLVQTNIDILNSGSF